MNISLINKSLRACLIGIIANLAFGSASGQAEEAASQIKRFEPAVGHWVNEEQQRESPDAPWQQVSSEWDIKFMPGGLFLETPGHIKLAEDQVISWIQVWGFDPVNQAPFSRWFASDGAYGAGPFEWSGRTVRMRNSVIFADGDQETQRCEWTFDADFSSAEGACERLTDGKWWTFRKIIGKKIK